MEHFVYKVNINNLRERLFTSARKAALFVINHADIYHMKLLRANRMPTILTRAILEPGNTIVAALDRSSRPIDGRKIVDGFNYTITKEEVH